MRKNFLTNDSNNKNSNLNSTINIKNKKPLRNNITNTILQHTTDLRIMPCSISTDIKKKLVTEEGMNNKNSKFSNLKISYINSHLKKNSINQSADYSCDLYSSLRKNNSTIRRKKGGKDLSTAPKSSNYQEQEYIVSIIENYSREVK